MFFANAGLSRCYKQLCNVLRRLGILLVVVSPLACENSSPTAPTAQTASGVLGGGGANLTAAMVSPTAAADGSTLKVSPPVPQSPIANGEVDTLTPRLTVANAEAPFVSGVLFPHQFEVYRVDGGIGGTLVDFGTVSQGSGVTSYEVQTPLVDDTSYQWRARAVFQETHGPWSALAEFRIDVPLEILAPVVLQPAQGEVVEDLRPVLEIQNPEIVGEPGTVFIEFQVATDQQFLDIVSIMSQEMGTHPIIHCSHECQSVSSALSREEKTSATPSVDLEAGATYFWRARGTNGSISTFPAAAFRVAETSEITGEFSAAAFFSVSSDASSSDSDDESSDDENDSSSDDSDESSSGTDADEIDLSEVTFLHTNVSSWAQTSTITSVTVGAPPICIRHTKAGKWPTIYTGGGVAVEGNPWVFAKIGGKWYAATWEWVRPGQTCKERGAGDFRTHVNGAAPLTSWTPKSGERVGFMMSTPARLGAQGPKRERSNVVVVTWP